MKFCIECGSKLIDGAKFCFNCGTKVPKIQIEAADNTEIEAEAIDDTEIEAETANNAETEAEAVDNTEIEDEAVNDTKSVMEPSVITEQSKQFSLYNNSIIFDEDFISFIKAQSIFDEFAWKKRKEYTEFYNSQIHTLEDLLSIGYSRYINDLNEAIKLGVRILMRYGVDYIDFNTLANLSNEYIELSSVWDPINEKVSQIEDAAESLAEYRNIQRASRSRWQGGGFGVSGAIKGALTAGALNIATDAFRGIGDSLTDSADREKIEKMKKSVMSNRKIVSSLSAGIYNSCLGVFISVYRILHKEEILVYETKNTKYQDKRMNNYLELYREDELEAEEIVDFLCECIQYAPYDIKYYIELYRLGLPGRKDILPIITFIGLKDEYQYIINSIDEVTMRAIDKNLPGSTIPELERKISLLEKLQEENPALSISAYHDKYTKEINRLEQLELEKINKKLKAKVTEIDKNLPGNTVPELEQKILSEVDSDIRIK